MNNLLEYERLLGALNDSRVGAITRDQPRDKIKNFEKLGIHMFGTN